MESVALRDFVRDTLVEIAYGVRNANRVAASDKDSDNVCPFSLRSNSGDNSKIPGITFDIAVTANRNQKDKAGFMVALASIGGGAAVEKTFGGETAHRIKFEVSLYQDFF